MIKVLFFDFDGTISDAKGIAYDSLVRTFDDFEFEFDRKKVLGLMGTKLEIMIEKLRISKVAGGRSRVAVKKIRKRFYKYFTEAALAGGIKPCVSLKPLWDLKKDYPLIVVSNSRGSFLRASIRKLKLGGLFRGVYGAEKFKHKDEMLEKLFRKYKIKASEAVYVGDRFSDVEFAREAGCVAVAIHNKCSWSSLAKMKKEKPDFIVKDFYELRKVVRGLENAE